MTEERFWDLCDEGARWFIIATSFLVCWPLLLLGYLAQVGRHPKGRDTEGGSVSEANSTRSAESGCAQKDL